jgi:ribokinase
MDLVVRAPHIPRAGETVLGGEFCMVAGGKGANQAVAAARMGGAVTLVARVGSGAFGTEALSGFEAEGIDTRYVTRDSEAEHGVALILVDHLGENAIAVAPGANARLSPDDVANAEAAFAECDLVLLQLEVPLATVEAAAALAKKHGKRVMLNPAPYLAVPDALLAQVDFLTPNETEAEMLLGGGEAGLSGVAGTAEELLRRGVGCVIVTLGKEGVFVVAPEEQYHQAGRRVKALDTTAAGDAFSGAFAVCVGEGMEFRAAVKHAVAASALAVTRLGAQSSLPRREEVEASLAS